MQADAHTLAVEQMRVSHPAALLERPGELQAWHSGGYPGGEVHLVGEGDLLTRPRFRAAIQAAVASAAAGPVLVDLSRLCFLSAGCAGDLLRLIARADGHEGVVVRCSSLHARTPRQLGAARIGRLLVDEAEAR